MLSADRCKFPKDGRGRRAGSERLAIAMLVLSRAKAARLKRPERLCLEELVD